MDRGGLPPKSVSGSIITCPNCGKKNRVRPDPEGVPRCAVCHQLLPWIAEADPQSFDAEIKASVPVVVDFWAPWRCRLHGYAVAGASGAQACRPVEVVKLNVDEAPDISARYRVQGIPLLVLLRDGQELDRLVGAVPESQIEAWLRSRERRRRRARLERTIVLVRSGRLGC